MLNCEMNGNASITDVVIVGGGVIGLGIARSLARRGITDVTIVERATLGSEASSAAGGMLAPQAEADSADSFFQLACSSRDMYPSFALELFEESGIDIELDRTGTLYVAFSEHDQEEIERRYHWQTEAGLAVELLSGDEVRRLEPAISPSARSALRFPLDTQVDNRRLVAALAGSVDQYGVKVLTGVTAESILLENNGVRGVETSLGKISAPIVVLANGAWVSFLLPPKRRLPDVRIEPVRGQMLCYEAAPRIARHVVYSPRGYVIPRLDGRLLAGATTEHTGFEKLVTAEGVNTVTANAIEIAPVIGSLPLRESWSGLRPRAADDLPVLGECAEAKGLYLAAGHYRNGILLTPVTGELIAAQILSGTPPPVLAGFSPDRFQGAGVI
jgi:glycine oxidase